MTDFGRFGQEQRRRQDRPIFTATTPFVAARHGRWGRHRSIRPRSSGQRADATVTSLITVGQSTNRPTPGPPAPPYRPRSRSNPDPADGTRTHRDIRSPRRTTTSDNGVSVAPPISARFELVGPVAILVANDLHAYGCAVRCSSAGAAGAGEVTSVAAVKQPVANVDGSCRGFECCHGPNIGHASTPRKHEIGCATELLEP
jgi:hypothetical protein